MAIDIAKIKDFREAFSEPAFEDEGMKEFQTLTLRLVDMIEEDAQASALAGTKEHLKALGHPDLNISPFLSGSEIPSDQDGVKELLVKNGITPIVADPTTQPVETNIAQHLSLIHI